VTIHQAILHGERVLGENKIDQPRLQSERILALALHQQRSKFYAELARELTSAELSRFDLLIQKRAEHYPLAYLEGVQEFYGRDFYVNDAVLIPRPETEGMIRAALDLTLPAFPRVLDLGSGSGNIPITLALELPGSFAVALEKSPEAIALMQKNLKGNVHPVRGDFYSISFHAASFDLITANLPYVEEHELKSLSPETAWEPRIALHVASLEESYVAVMKQAARVLKYGGHLLMEFGHGQSERLKAAASSVTQLRLIDVRSDQRGIPRILILQKGT
jgi:release factor glutamine methyltransferase